MRFFSRGLEAISKAGLMLVALCLMLPTQAWGKAWRIENVFTITCPKDGPPGTEYVDVDFELDRLLIPQSEKDGSPNFDFELYYSAAIFTDMSQAKSICPDQSGVWKLTFPIATLTHPNQFYEYPLARVFRMKNVPKNAVAYWAFGLKEIDIASDDWGDLGPGPKTRSMFLLHDIAKGVTVDRNGNPLHVQLDRTKRLIGDGKDIGTVDFIAGLDFIIRVKAEKPMVMPTKPYDHICDAYAHVAMHLSKEAVRLGCGFKPPIWSTEYQGHFDWCMHGENVLENANDVRAAELAKCKSPPGTRSTNPPSPKIPTLADRCKNYALEAVETNRKAIDFGCGFNTPDWSNNHQAHFDWCMSGTNIVDSRGETARRAAELAKCQASKPAPPPTPPTPPLPSPNTNPAKNPACDLYANEALRLAAGASALGCGFAGPRWEQSYSVHYNFCTSGANPVILLAEAAARDSEYRACQATAGAATPKPAPMPVVVPNWVFPDSHTRLLTQTDLSGLSKPVLWQARNEIFARKGQIFSTAKAKNFFGQKPWYQPTAKSVSLNAVEQANVALIRSFE